MKKSIRIILTIIVVVLIILLGDTIQAKAFNNRPIIKFTEDFNGGDLYQKDKGIFVYTYIYTDGTRKTVFKWENNESKSNSIDEENNLGGNEEMNSNISVIIKGNTYNAVLEENETTEKFLELLPQEYNMEELNGNEKYVYIEDTLPTNSYNLNHIEKGDIMLYGNNCIVVFYKSFETSYSYTKIGHIEDLIDLGSENITIKFEK